MKLKTDKIIYHTKTQEDFDDLMIKLRKQGFEPLKNYFFQSYKERTCVRLGKDNRLVYGGLDFYKKDFVCADYEIVKYKANPPYKIRVTNMRVIEEIDDVLDIFEYDTEPFTDDMQFPYFLSKWLVENGGIETLNYIRKYGYELKKVYTVHIPTPNQNKKFYLSKNGKDGKVIISKIDDDKKLANHFYLTELEIKEDFEYLWCLAKEVE